MATDRRSQSNLTLRFVRGRRNGERPVLELPCERLRFVVASASHEGSIRAPWHGSRADAAKHKPFSLPPMDSIVLMAMLSGAEHFYPCLQLDLQHCLRTIFDRAECAENPTWLLGPVHPLQA
jgi:hypothetical protein